MRDLTLVTSQTYINEIYIGIQTLTCTIYVYERSNTYLNFKDTNEWDDNIYTGKINKAPITMC